MDSISLLPDVIGWSAFVIVLLAIGSFFWLRRRQ
jgi:hypothetical protein